MTSPFSLLADSVPIRQTSLSARLLAKRERKGSLLSSLLLCYSSIAPDHLLYILIHMEFPPADTIQV